MSQPYDWVKPTLVGSLATFRPYRQEDADGAWWMVSEPEGRALTGRTLTFTRVPLDRWVGTCAEAHERLDLVIEDNASAIRDDEKAGFTQTGRLIDHEVEWVEMELTP